MAATVTSVIHSATTTMGWFSSSSKPDEDAGTTTRQNRKICWEKRDAYFACLDKQNVIKAGDEGNACAAEKKEYEGHCAKSWVSCRIDCGSVKC